MWRKDTDHANPYYLTEKNAELEDSFRLHALRENPDLMPANKLAHALRSVGQAYSWKEVAELNEYLTLRKVELFSMEGYKEFYMKRANEVPDGNLIREAFLVLSNNLTARIGKSMLRHFLTTQCDVVSVSSADKLLKEFPAELGMRDFIRLCLGDPDKIKFVTAEDP